MSGFSIFFAVCRIKSFFYFFLNVLQRAYTVTWVVGDVISLGKEKKRISFVYVAIYLIRLYNTQMLHI